MAQVKVSELPAASGLNTTDVVVVNQSGVTKRTTAGAFTDTMTGFLQAGTGATARTMRSKGRDVISVKDFGATGDGTTNDAATVQSALDAASGKALYFPTGTYLINTTLDIPTNVLIFGDGYGSEIKAAANPVAQAVSRSNVGMRGLRFTSNGSVSFTITFRLCTNVRVESCIINHLVGATLGTQAMRFQGTIGASVVNSQFYDSSEAHIYLDSWPVAGAGTHSDLIDIVGCYFENTIVGNYATPAAIYQYYCKKLAVDNCTFKNIRSDGTGANMAYSVYEGDGAADSLSVTNCTTIAPTAHTMVQNSNAPHCHVESNRFYATGPNYPTGTYFNWLYQGGPALGSVNILGNFVDQAGIYVQGAGTAATATRSAIVSKNQLQNLTQSLGGAIRIGNIDTTYVYYAEVTHNTIYKTYSACVDISQAAYAIVDDNYCANWNTGNNVTDTAPYSMAIYWEGDVANDAVGRCRRNRLENNTQVVADTGYPTDGIVVQNATNLVRLSGNHLSGVTNNYIRCVPDDGTYTPTATLTTNLDAATPSVAQFMRVGETVTVSGHTTIDPTAAAPTATVLGLSLPFASSFTSSIQAAGSAHSQAATDEQFVIYADATNDRVAVDGLARSAASHDIWYSYTYRVI